jgi:photosystem II stability/assembly factor-like uncharacterized protein
MQIIGDADDRRRASYPMRRAPRCLTELVTVFLSALSVHLRAAEAPASAWEPVGLSGGGALFAPAVSPADPKRMMINCDMSGAYLSADGGRSWRMIHHTQLRSNIRCRPAFHPTDPRTIVAAAGWEGLKVSHDGGERWEPLGRLPGGPRGEIAIDPDNPAFLLVGAGEFVCRSLDGGKTWSRCDGPRGAALAFHIDRTSPTARRVCFAGTAEGVWRSDDGGATWAEKTAGLPSKKLLAFAGGSNAKEKRVMLYGSVTAREEGGRYAGGLYRSADRGETWESAVGPGLNTETKAFDRWAAGPVAQYPFVLTTNAKPNTVYAFNTNTGVPPPHHASCYRSDDAGRTWRAAFQADPRWPPINVERDYVVAAVRQYYQGAPTGAAISAEHPDHLLFVDDARCYVTADGGTSWACGHTRPAPGFDPAAKGQEPRWLCNGLVVTSTWHFYIDPFEPARRYICYTDIGFARSFDRGKTWQWWAIEGRAPWTNTCYELAFDPKIPGKLWGAFSNVHDIPNANIILGRHRDQGPGGICASADFGATWKPSNEGMPLAPATSVVVDPKSPPGARVLYAGLFGPGVYKSADDGRTWKPAVAGLGAESNRRVCRVHLHPDKTLFALVTARRAGGRFAPEGVGLHRSKDGGATWERANASTPLLWPKDFTVDPKDSRIVYLGAADAGGQKEGGLYRTADGGATWSRLAREGPEHFGAYLHPKHPGWIYMTLCEDAPGAGLWLSRDNGATWRPMPGLPFANAQRVAFDPADEKSITVTTFGGSVWRGPLGE